MRYRELLEHIGDDPTLLKKVVAYTRSAIDWGGGDGETWTDRFYREHPAYDPDGPSLREIHRRDRAFNKWLADEIENEAGSLYYDLIRLFRNGFIRLYREIAAPSDWQPNFDHPGHIAPRQLDLFGYGSRTEHTHPGLYWSWDIHAAEAHWAGNGIKWLIIADATKDQIDWVGTLGQNITMPDEKEVRLKPDASVKVISVRPRR